VFHEQNDPLCLVVSHGARIIGASCLSGEREVRSHLLTGPCLSMEYHNRGLATALLAQSLLTLREAGVSLARGITKEGSITAQFIYPKFGSALAAPEKRAVPSEAR
jgi:predicted acetyltransferase